jgi:hypothetical protein
MGVEDPIDGASATTVSRGRILNLQVHPHPDGQRVRLHATLSPFQDPPTLEAEIRRPDGSLVSSAVIVGAEGPEIEITLHLKNEGTPGAFVARLILESGTLGTQDIREAGFKIPPLETYY